MSVVGGSGRQNAQKRKISQDHQLDNKKKVCVFVTKNWDNVEILINQALRFRVRSREESIADSRHGHS